MAMQPGGLLAPDPGALSPAQLEQLRNFKIQTRIANENYLRTHKEVELLLSGFFRNSFQKLDICAWLQRDSPREMFLKRPDNIREFAAEYFTDPRLPDKIDMQLMSIEEEKVD